MIFSRLEGWRTLISGEKLLPRIGLGLLGLAVILFGVMSWREGVNKLYLAGIPLALIAVGIQFRRVRVDRNTTLLGFMAIAMLTISIAVLGLGEAISLSRSTRAPIQQFYKESPKSRAPIVVLFHDPRSVHFYVAKIMNHRARVFSGNSFQALQKWRAARVMVKVADQTRLEGIDLTGLELDRCIGSWCLYRWKRPKQQGGDYALADGVREHEPRV